KLIREFDLVVDDVFEVYAGKGRVGEKGEESGLAFAGFVFGNAAGMHTWESQVGGHVGLTDVEGLANLAQLSAEILLPSPLVSHQELPPDLLPLARKFFLPS